MQKPWIQRLVAAAALLLAPLSTHPQTSVPVEPGGRVVLVLPFDNRSGQVNLNWIGDSFPDTLNQRLTSVGFLTISRDDRVFALDHLGFTANFRPTRATTLRIAQTLDANYVIVGSYTLQNKRIQVQAQVLEVDKLHLSAPLTDSTELARLFDVENAIAWKIARQIDPGFSVAEQTFLSASAGIRLTAFEDYIRGTAAPTPTERVKRLQAAVADSPTYTAAQLALGKELYADREYAQAATTLARVPHTDRAALEANFFLGLSRFNSGRYADAEAAFAFVASRLPLPEVVNDQAVAQARQGRNASALFRRASNADPNDPDYHYNLAVSLYRSGDFAGAQREVEATLKLRPTDTGGGELRTLIASGRPAAPVAAGAARPAPAAKPDLGFIPTERLRRTYSEASFRQAALQLDQVRALRLATLPPARRAEEYTALGRDFLSQGLLPEAEQEFHAAIEADPANPAGHAGLAQVREGSANPEEARAEAKASLAIKPNVDALLVLARLDLAKNDLSASAADVSSALRLEPANGAARGMRQALVSRGQSIP